MHIKLSADSYNKAIAWTDLGPTLEYCEFFDDKSKKLYDVEVKFMSSNHCIISERDYLMYPEKDKEDKLLIDINYQVTIFLSISSSLRSSNIWP